MMKTDSENKADMAMDRKMKIREGSKKDEAMDSKRSMTKSSTTKMPTKATIGIPDGDPAKGPAMRSMNKFVKHPAGSKGNKMGAQMSAKTTVKQPVKVANTRTLFQRIANKKLFKD